MMVCRRRWRLLAVFLVATSPALAFGAAGIDLAAEAAKLKTAKGREAVAVREGVLSKAPPATSVTERNDYGKEVVRNFRPLLSEPNPDARLNTAILFGRLETLSTDAALMEALKNSDPAVRYWGAKGLGGTTFSGLIIRVGPKMVIDSLRAAAKAETSNEVQVQILHAVVVYENLDAILDSLEGIANHMATNVPNMNSLDETTAALKWVKDHIKGATDAQKERTASIMARLASFAAQQQVESKAITGSIPPSFTKSTLDVINNAVGVLGNVGAAGAGLSDTSSAEMALISVNALVGFDGRTGDLQKSLPKVAPPAKVGAAPSSTAPAATTAPAH